MHRRTLLKQGLAVAGAMALEPATALAGGSEDRGSMLAFGDSITYGIGASDIATTAWVPMLAATLGIGVSNYAIGGTTMLGDPGVGAGSILAQMLAVSPPPRHTVCVTIAGVNDTHYHGTDAGWLASFQDGLETGLLHLTSRRRTPGPKNARERRLFAQGKLPSVADGATVWVGNTPRESAGFWINLGSDAAWALYVAAVGAAVANVAAQGRDVRLVDVASAYDPDTMGSDPPTNLHPSDVGYLAIKNAFYAAMLT